MPTSATQLALSRAEKKKKKKERKKERKKKIKKRNYSSYCFKWACCLSYCSYEHFIYRAAPGGHFIYRIVSTGHPPHGKSVVFYRGKFAGNGAASP